jgi:hypothetical protein
VKIDASRVKASFARRREGLDQRVRHALDEAARVALSVAQGLAPGRIPETITARPTSGFVAGVRVASSWKGAVWHENGTPPHTIQPKNGKVLAFRVNGDLRFARVVNHPGTKAIHFMAQGREAGRIVLRALLERAIAGG